MEIVCLDLEGVLVPEIWINFAKRTGIKALEAQRLPEPRIHALWDRGEPTPTYIYRRGDYLSPSRLVGPGVPGVLTIGNSLFEGMHATNYFDLSDDPTGTVKTNDQIHVEGDLGLDASWIGGTTGDREERTETRETP